MNKHAACAAFLGAVLIWSAPAGADPRIADNISAVPHDRQFFNYNYYGGSIGYRHLNFSDSDQEVDFGQFNLTGNWRINDMWRFNANAALDLFDAEPFGEGHTLAASGGFFYIPGTETRLRIGAYPHVVVGPTFGVANIDFDNFIEADIWWAGATAKAYLGMVDIGASLWTGNVDQDLGETDFFYVNLNAEYFFNDRLSLGGTFDHIDFDESDVSANRFGVNLNWQPWYDRSLSFTVDAGQTRIDYPFGGDDKAFDVGLRVNWACFGSQPEVPTLRERSYFSYNEPIPVLLRTGL